MNRWLPKKMVVMFFLFFPILNHEKQPNIPRSDDHRWDESHRGHWLQPLCSSPRCSPPIGGPPGGDLRISHGNLMEITWKPHGNPMETTWKPHGNHIETWGNFMETRLNTALKPHWNIVKTPSKPQKAVQYQWTWFTEPFLNAEFSGFSMVYILESSKQWPPHATGSGWFWLQLADGSNSEVKPPPSTTFIFWFVFKSRYPLVI